MKHQLCVGNLRNGKVTLKRYVLSRKAHLTNNWRRANHAPLMQYQYKSIPGMPLFDTVEQAQEYRNLIGWFIDI